MKKAIIVTLLAITVPIWAIPFLAFMVALMVYEMFTEL